MSNDLLPCPFCGCKDVAADREFDKRVHCYRCGADGPSIPYAPDPKFWDWDSRALIDAPADASLAKMLAEARAEGMREAGRCPQCAAREEAFLETIRIKQECRHCGYQSMEWLGENAACPMSGCHGGMTTLPHAAEAIQKEGGA